MAFLYNEIYDKIPEEVLNTDAKTATGFVSDLIKSAVPPADYHPEEFSKAILPLNKFDVPELKQRPKKTYLTKKIKNKLKLSKCPKTGWNFKSFEPLTKLWQSYMKENLHRLLLNQSITDIQREDRTYFNNILAKADYHGAQMKIIRSKNPSLVGISGICIIDTKNTFKIISDDNKCRTIPKQECVFEMTILNVILTVYGKLMTIRPAERSVKKIKSLMFADL